jgi:hypothetical protein
MSNLASAVDELLALDAHAISGPALGEQIIEARRQINRLEAGYLGMLEVFDRTGAAATPHPAGAKATTSSTGPTAARPASTTARCSAADTTTKSTPTATKSPKPPTVRTPSASCPHRPTLERPPQQSRPLVQASSVHSEGCLLRWDVAGTLADCGVAAECRGRQIADQRGGFV